MGSAGLEEVMQSKEDSALPHGPEGNGCDRNKLLLKGPSGDSQFHLRSGGGENAWRG